MREDGLLDRVLLGPARRRRWMRRRLAQLDAQRAVRQQVPLTRPGPRDWTPVPCGRVARRRRPGGPVSGLLGVAVCVAAMVGAHQLVARSPEVLAARTLPRPPAAAGEQTSRLVPLPPAAATTTGYAFLAHQADGVTPVAYDPCRALHYVVHGAPSNGHEDEQLRRAVTTMSAAAGIAMVYDGTTTETPSEHRAPYQPSRYGARWAPVLISWTDEQETRGLAGAAVGLGGSLAESAPDGRRLYATGEVWLDTPALTRIMREPTGAAQVRAVIEHELGHVLGLGHVQSPAALMAPETHLLVVAPGPGDLAGLAVLASQPCDRRF